MNDKVSVIVPIYKVEEYLEQCINTIINQTYTNLEILLIDDGSPDRCGIICDEYSKKDSRIKVIHKKNGGISSARNTGIKESTGKFIIFVDSDDYVDRCFVEKLIGNLLLKKADIVMCGFFRIDDAGIINRKSKIYKNKEYNSENAIMELLDAYGKADITNHLWNKIYKRSLFEEIEFPNGKKYEDLDVMYKLFIKSNKIITIDDVMYYYRVRNGSIMNTPTESMILDKMECVRRRSDCLKIAFPHFLDAIDLYDFKNSVHCLIELIKITDVETLFENNIYKLLIEQIYDSSNKKYYKYLNIKEKIAFLLVKSKRKNFIKLLKR